MSDVVVSSPVVPSTTTPAPTEGTPSATPAPAGGTPPASTGEKNWQLEYQKKVREYVAERRKWEAEKKTLSEARTKAESYEKWQQSAKLNPVKALQELYGDNWYDRIVESKLNGVPPADLIQAEVTRIRDEMRAEMESKLGERDTAEKQRLEQSQQQQLEQARRSIQSEASDWYASAKADYPLLEGLGDAAAVARGIAQRIETEFHRSAQRDESGRVVRQGRVLTAKEAGELIEGELFALSERAVSHEKYRQKLAEKLTPLSTTKQPGTVVTSRTQQPSSGPQSSSGQQQRKTLSNDITGSTAGEKPKTLSRQERLERAAAAWDAAKAAKQRA